MSAGKQKQFWHWVSYGIVLVTAGFTLAGIIPLSHEELVSFWQHSAKREHSIIKQPSRF